MIIDNTILPHVRMTSTSLTQKKTNPVKTKRKFNMKTTKHSKTSAAVDNAFETH